MDFHFPLSCLFFRTLVRCSVPLLVLVLGGSGCRPAAPQTQGRGPSLESTSEASEPTGAAERAPVVDEPPPPLLAAAPELKVKRSAQVSILGYHDFTSGKSSNPMVINVQKFRDQMAAIRDAKLKVITMDDYLAWRRNERDLPGDPCLMITIDDGWKGVHTLALPVLREFGYPFTVFLYKAFVNGGGRSLTTAEIKDIMAGGGTVGCHSVSHPFPSEFRRRAKGVPEEYTAFVQKEFVESKVFFENLLGVKVPTFAYPGGYYTPEMAQKGRDEWGYEALFTCNPVRTTWDTPLAEIGRFIVYGNDPNDRNFKAATVFGGGGGDGLARQLLGGEIGEDGTQKSPLVVVKPSENETVTDRRPVIEVDLAKLTDVDPASISMRIPGLGLVPCVYDKVTHKITWRPHVVLRSNEVSVNVRLKRASEEKEDMVAWKFFIDPVAHYLTSLPLPSSATPAEVVPAVPSVPPGSAVPPARGTPVAK
jgi:peptidoglycan/xylan/chitin deacetylase (PgdA/CDA1 family)